MRKLMTLAMTLLSLSAFAQSEVHTAFNGRVVDENGNGIKRLRVDLVNGKANTTTDKKGYFAFLDVDPRDTVIITARNVDYMIPVDGKNSMMVVVNDGSFSASEDDELVGIGFGNVKKSMRITPGAAVSGEALIQMGFTTISEALVVLVPGVSISSKTSDSGEAQFNIRGVRSVNAGNETLLVLDGMVVPDFSTISLRDVDTINVLKDGSVYGSRGANGVIEVKTKRM